MTDHAALPEPAGTRKEPPGPDKLLSWVCALWLLNALTGAAVAIREDLPGELIGGVFTGQDASAEFFKGPGTALSPGLAHIGAQALFAVLSTRGGRVGDGRGRGADRGGRGGYRRGARGEDNLQSLLAKDVRSHRGSHRVGRYHPLVADECARREAAARSERQALREPSA